MKNDKYLYLVYREYTLNGNIRKKYLYIEEDAIVACRLVFELNQKYKETEEVAFYFELIERKLYLGSFLDKDSIPSDEYKKFSEKEIKVSSYPYYIVKREEASDNDEAFYITSDQEEAFELCVYINTYGWDRTIVEEISIGE